MADIRAFEQYSPQIAPDVYLDPGCSVIGEVTIGAQSSVWPGVVIRGDVASISIGAHTNIQDASVLHVSHSSEFHPSASPLTIGDQVTVGHKVILHGCTVGNRCLIGMGAIVMDDAVIEDQVLLAAGSLVPGRKRLYSGYLYQGSPAHQVRALSDQELAYLDYSAAHYVRLAQRHLTTLRD